MEYITLYDSYFLYCQVLTITYHICYYVCTVFLSSLHHLALYIMPTHRTAAEPLWRAKFGIPYLRISGDNTLHYSQTPTLPHPFLRYPKILISYMERIIQGKWK